MHENTVPGPESITPLSCNNNLIDQSTTVVRASQHIRYVPGPASRSTGSQRVQPTPAAKFWAVQTPPQAIACFPAVTTPAIDPASLKYEEDERRRLARIVSSLQIAGVEDIDESSNVSIELTQEVIDAGNAVEDIPSSVTAPHFRSRVPARRIILSGSNTDPDGIADLPLADAMLKWHEFQKPRIGARTHQNNWHNAMQLLKFFGDMKPSEIRTAHLHGYQEYRTHNIDNRWAKKAGASCINHELSVLQQILKHAGQWNKFRDHYRALPLPRAKEQKVFTEKEERDFLKLIQSRQDLQLPCLVALFTLNTTCAGSELRHLKWKNLDLNHINAEGKIEPIMTVPEDGAKNEFRARRVSLNETAFAVMKKILERARRLGSSQPEHYLFPYSVRGYNYNPTRPTSESWLKRDWNKLRKAAKAPWLTPHCLRYMAITALYEAGVPEPTIQAMAGHTSARMSRHYNRTRNSQLAAAAAVLDSRRRYEPKPEWAEFVDKERHPERRRIAQSKGRVLAFRSVG